MNIYIQKISQFMVFPNGSCQVMIVCYLELYEEDKVKHISVFGRFPTSQFLVAQKLTHAWGVRSLICSISPSSHIIPHSMQLSHDFSHLKKNTFQKTQSNISAVLFVVQHSEVEPTLTNTV